MTHEFLNNFISEKTKNIEQLFLKKNEQYANNDPVANFTKGGEIMFGASTHYTQLEALKSYMLKHVAHIYGNGNDINTKGLDESLGDVATYCLIALAILEDYKNESRDK